MATLTDAMSEDEKIEAIEAEIFEMAKTQLGPLYLEADEQILKNLRYLVIQEALDICNMTKSSRNMILIEAMVIQAVIIAYQNRGVEGVKSQTELGQNNDYIHWIDYLRDNLIKSGKRFVQ